MCFNKGIEVNLAFISPKLKDIIMCNILVIDDEEAIVLMITMALAKHGFDVEIAADGIEGIKKFDQGRFGLVITDIRMPGLNGNVVADHIRNSDRKYTPIIGISGTPWLFKRHNFNVVLCKPFSLQTLIDTVKGLAPAPLKAVAVE